MFESSLENISFLAFRACNKGSVRLIIVLYDMEARTHQVNIKVDTVYVELDRLFHSS